MFLPLRLLAIELQRSSCVKQYNNYLRAINKLQVNSLRIKFLENCKQANIIPHFLKFRVPTNGCLMTTQSNYFNGICSRKRLLERKVIIRIKYWNWRNAEMTSKVKHQPTHSLQSFSTHASTKTKYIASKPKLTTKNWKLWQQNKNTHYSALTIQ